MNNLKQCMKPCFIETQWYEASVTGVMKLLLRAEQIKMLILVTWLIDIWQERVCVCVVSVTEALEECVGVIQDNCSMSSLYFQHFLILHANGIWNSPPSFFVWLEIPPKYGFILLCVPHAHKLPLTHIHWAVSQKYTCFLSSQTI